MAQAQSVSVPGHDGTGTGDPPCPSRWGWYAWGMLAAFAGFSWICWSMGWLGLPVFAGGTAYLVVGALIALQELPREPDRHGDRRPLSGRMRHLPAHARHWAIVESK